MRQGKGKEVNKVCVYEWFATGLQRLNHISKHQDLSTPELSNRGQWRWVFSRQLKPTLVSQHFQLVFGGGAERNRTGGPGTTVPSAMGQWARRRPYLLVIRASWFTWSFLFLRVGLSKQCWGQVQNQKQGPVIESLKAVFVPKGSGFGDKGWIS